MLVDLPDDSLFDALSDGDPIVVRSSGARARSGEVLCRGEVLARGEVLDLERVLAETEARRQEAGEALERFALNTIEHMREERELLDRPDPDAALPDRLPGPLDARRRARRGRAA